MDYPESIKYYLQAYTYSATLLLEVFRWKFQASVMSFSQPLVV